MKNLIILVLLVVAVALALTYTPLGSVVQQLLQQASQETSTWECKRNGQIIATLTPDDQKVWRDVHGSEAKLAWHTEGKCDGYIQPAPKPTSKVQPTATPFRVKPMLLQDASGAVTRSMQPYKLFELLNSLNGGKPGGAWLEPEATIGGGLGDDIFQFEIDRERNLAHTITIVAYIKAKQGYVDSPPQPCSLLYDPDTLQELQNWINTQNAQKQTR